MKYKATKTIITPNLKEIEGASHTQAAASYTPAELPNLWHQYLQVNQQHFRFDCHNHDTLFLMHKHIYSCADIEKHAFAY